MRTICKTTLLAPEPTFVGTTLTLDIGATGLLSGLYEGNLAAGHDRGTIDWGDGCVEEVGDFLQLTHSYAQPGRYEIRLSDDFVSFAYTAATETWSVADTNAQQLARLVCTARELKTLLRYSFFHCSHMDGFDLSGASIERLCSATFRSCFGLAGELYLPSVSDLEGTRKIEVFKGCGNVTVIHFAAAHEASVKASTAYQADPTLGTDTGTCAFDLE